jgi:tetratricopeptide (TPR) repeat protein
MIVAVVALALVGGDCEQRSRVSTDPLKDKAREKYAEGRRLFLTCDPNNYEKAARLFEDALAYWEDYPEALAAWAEVISMWYAFNMPEELFQKGYMKAQRAVRLAPELDMGYRAMADLFRHHRDPDTNQVQTDYAMEVIDMALKINPASAENLYVKGSIQLAADPEAAVQILNQARMLNPDLGKVYFNLGAAHQMMAKKLRAEAAENPDMASELQARMSSLYETAIEDLKTYQKLVPGDLAGYCSRGMIYLQEGKLELAEQMFQQTVSRNLKPDPSQEVWRKTAYGQLARIAENRNDLEGARLYLEGALAIAPRDIQTLEELVRITKLLKDKKAAEEYAKRLKESIESARSQEQKGPAVDE